MTPTEFIFQNCNSAFYVLINLMHLYVFSGCLRHKIRNNTWCIYSGLFCLLFKSCKQVHYYDICNSIILQLVACFDFNQSVNHARQYPGDGGIVEKFGSEELAKNTVLSTFFTVSQIKAISRLISFLSSFVPSLKDSCSYFSNNFPTLKLFNMSWVAGLWPTEKKRKLWQRKRQKPSEVRESLKSNGVINETAKSSVIQSQGLKAALSSTIAGKCE